MLPHNAFVVLNNYENQFIDSSHKTVLMKREINAELLIFIINCMFFFMICVGLGDAWGASPLCNNPRETCIKELGSHLLQVIISFDAQFHIFSRTICVLRDGAFLNV